MQRNIKYEGVRREERQREVLEGIFQRELGLHTLQQWAEVPGEKIKRINKMGNTVLTRYYLNDKKRMLRALYPHFPWHFPSRLSLASSTALLKLNHKRKQLEEIYNEMQLRSLADWQRVSKATLLLHPLGARLLSSSSLTSLLSSLYPNYPWVPHNPKGDYFAGIENQRRAMGDIFDQLRLKEVGDWLLVSVEKFCRYGGRPLLARYSFSFPRLLIAIYPLHRWPFAVDRSADDHVMNAQLIAGREKRRGEVRAERATEKKLERVERHRRVMAAIARCLNVNSVGDWEKISIDQLEGSGGGELLRYYKRSHSLLLRSLFPNHRWPLFAPSLPFYPSLSFFRSIDNQRHYMEELFAHLQFKSLEDWLRSPKRNIKRNKGKLLLSLYSHSLPSLLSALYPNYPWHFPPRYYYKTRSHIPTLIRKYAIKQKSDWYRSAGPIRKLLQRAYPEERWVPGEFLSRSKKSQQRILFAAIERLYGREHWVLENYRPPHFHLFEFDIFIPSLNVAFEYQGILHYDELPFVPLELYQTRDKKKEQLTSEIGVHLIGIPYWWDQSLSSLRHSIQSQLSSLL